MKVLAFLLAVAWWPGAADAAVTPRWALVSVSVPLLLLVDVARGRARWIPGLEVAMALVTWAGLGWVLWAPQTLDGAEALWELELLLGALLLGAWWPRAQAAWEGFALGLCVNAGICVAQVLGWQGLQQVTMPGGLFMNRIFLGELAAVTFVGLLSVAKWRSWLWLGSLVGTLVCLLMSQSKGALASVACVGLTVCWQKSRKLAMSLACLGTLCLIFVVYNSPYSQGSANARLNYALDTLPRLNVLGAGVGQFYTSFPQVVTHTDLLRDRPEYLHNEWLQTWYELGLVGLVLVATLFWLARMAGAPLVALATMGLASFPWHLPATTVALGLCLGTGLRLRAAARERKPAVHAPRANWMGKLAVAAGGPDEN